jgi:hypothetical protein
MPSAKWTRQLIRIDTDCGPVEVPATRLGPLAVHFGIGSHRKGISITHVRTGWRIASTNSREAAQRIAEALAELNWETLEVDSVPPDLQAEVSSILNGTDLRSSRHLTADPVGLPCTPGIPSRSMSLRRTRSCAQVGDAMN